MTAQKNTNTLCPSQRRYWFLDHLSGKNPSYVTSNCTRIEGKLDLDKLTATIQEAVQNFPGLRSSVEVIDDTAQSVAREEARVNVAVVDVRSVNEMDRGPRVQELVREQVRQQFYLDMAPLVRGQLIRYSDEVNILVLSAHRGVATDKSLDLLRRTVLNKLVSNEWLNLSDFREVSESYNQWIESDEAAKLLESWKATIAPETVGISLASNDRPAELPWTGSTTNVDLPASLWSKVVKVAEQKKAGPRDLLLAAWHTLLGRVSEDEALNVGSAANFANPFDGSNHVHPVEFFQVGSTPEGGSRFDEHLQRVQGMASAPESKNGLDWAYILEKLAVQRQLDRTPGFAIGFEYEEFNPLPKSDSLRCSNESLDLGVVRRELTLRVQEREDGPPAVALQYALGVYDEEVIVQIGQRLVHVLEQVTADPSLQVSSVSPVLPAELEKQLENWQGASADYGTKAIHLLFEEQAEQTPDNIALSCGDERISYADLNKKATRIAAELAELGVKSESIVGILMEHSIETLACILGIFKAGGAYLPLDPEYPDDRLNFMIKDADAKVLLQRKSEGLKYSPSKDVKVVFADELSGDKNFSPPEVSLDSLAYVIYTSGSTGTPKGVEVEHKSIVDLTAAFTTRPGITDADVVATVAPFVFDMSVLTLFPPLAKGAQVLLATREESRDGRALGARLDSEKATMMKATPSAWRILVESGWAGRPELTAMAGGEQFTPKLARSLQERCGSVWNHYGPTEATAICTMFPLYETSDDRSIPIGSPLPNTKAYILDGNQNPVPIGSPGELCIGGPCLARGYRNRKELTDSKFVPNPFIDGEKIYRTGDKVRYLPTGHIEFVGRFDDQVKVRGYRIELGEIEAKLRAIPQVEHAVVIVREDEADDQRIVAYLTWSGEALDQSAIRTSLRENLPAYMVPTAFVTMDSLPVNARGKLDRKALPAPSAAPTVRSSESGPDMKLPRDVTERKLVQLWETTLKMRGIGVNDDFFELGGHSLLAMQLLQAVEREFQQKLPLSTVFQFRTIEEMSALIDADEQKEDHGWHIVEMNKGGTKPPIFFIPPLSGQVTGIANLAKYLGPDQRVFSVETWGEFGKHPLYTLESATDRYLERINEIYPEGPFILAGQSAGNWLAFVLAKKLAKAGRPPALLTIMDVGSPENFVAYWSSHPIEEGRFACLACSNLVAQTGGFAAYRRIWTQLDAYAQMNPSEYWALSVNEVRRAKVLPEDFSDERIRRFMRWMMWNAASILTQGIDVSPYPGQIALMRSDRPDAERPSLLKDRWGGDPKRGWSELSDKEVYGPYWVGSNHHHWSYLYREDGAALTAEAWKDLLSKYDIESLEFRE